MYTGILVPQGSFPERQSWLTEEQTPFRRGWGGSEEGLFHSPKGNKKKTETRKE